MRLRQFWRVAGLLLATSLLPATPAAAASGVSVLPGFGSSDAAAAAGAGLLYDGGYTSSDGGATWSEVPGDAWTSVAVDPADARHVFVYRLADGLRASRGAGATWVPVDTSACAIGQGADARIVSDPVAAGTLYLSSAAGPGSVALCRSDDGGSSWSLAGASSISPLLEATPPLARSVLVTLHAAAGTVLVGRSSDGGATWTETATDLPAVVANDLRDVCGAGPACRLISNPLHPSWLVLRDLAGSRFTSADGGLHWTQEGLDPHGDFFRADSWMTVAGHPGVVVATAPDGVWRSVDGGLIYHRRLERQGRLVEDANGVLYLLGSRGAIVSSDGGATWRGRGHQGSSQPFPDLDASPFLSSDATGAVFASTGAGVFRLDASGAWTAATSQGLDLRGAVAVGRHVILAIRTLVGGRAELTRSPDGGATWTLPALPPCSIHIASRFRQAALLTVVPGTSTIFLSTSSCAGGDVLLSTDAGATWKRSLIANQSGYPLSFVPVAHSSTILLGSVRSDHSGKAYTFKVQPALARAKAVAIAATRRAIYGVGTATGSVELLAFSGDGRSTVGRIPGPLSGNPVVLVDPSRPRYAVAAVTLGETAASLPAAFETTNGGRSWRRLALDGARASCKAASATLARGRVFVALGAAVNGDRQCAGVIASAAL